MHASRYAIAGLALVASTIIVSCGSDNNSTPLDSINTPVTLTTGGSSNTTLTTGSSSNSSVVGTTLP